MNKNYFFLLITLLFSCSKENEDPAVAVAPESTIIASVDGKDWKSSDAGAVLVNGTISLAGKSSDDSQLVFSIKGTKTGKYTISGSSGTSLPDNSVSYTPVNANVNTNPTFTSAYFTQLNVGDVEITEINETDKTISGTFSSKVMRAIPSVSTLEIKQGSFTKIKYTTQPTNVPGNSASAKIDNATFTPATVGGVVAFEKIVLNFLDASNKTLAISLPETVSTGTFDLGSMGSTHSATYTAGSSVYESVSGKIVITKHDKTAKRIEGTFNFNGELFPLGGGNLAVTNGSFAVTYF